MHLLLQFRQNISLIEESLGYKFLNQKLLEKAFIHRSFINEQSGEVEGHNERLEFLGDAVLGLIISDFLFCDYPEKNEGELSELRARLVEADALRLYMDKLNVAEYLIVGKGEVSTDRRDSHNANLVEAIIGAIYLDGGLEKARAFLFSNLKTEFLKIIESPNRNWKAELQDYAQKKFQLKPLYILTKDEGPDHDKTFYVKVEVNSEILGEGVGPSKKEAERKAAEEAIAKLDSLNP